MKYVFIFIVMTTLFGCTANKSVVEVSQNISEQIEKPFPQNWYGKWRGTLMIYNDKGGIQEIPMEIHCASTDSTHRHQLALVYREGEEQDFRDYELVAIDAKSGHYQTDEKNTIFLDAFYFNGILYSRFEVSGTLITSRIEKRNSKLHFEIISGSLTPIATTGDEEVTNFPPVNSYNIKVSQRAELIKYEN